MRGCLFTLLLAAVVVVGALVFAGPPVVGGVATVALAAAGFSGDETSVDVRAEPFDLVRLHADEMRIRSREASFRDLRMDDVDVTVEDVDLGARSFERIEGTLSGVLVVRDGAADVRVSRIEIAGRAPRPSARLVIPAAEVELLVADSIEQASGRRPSTVLLEAPDLLTFTIDGVTAGGRLSVDEAGGLVLDPAVDVLPRSDVFRPDSGTPLRLTGFEIAGGDLVLVGRVDLA